MRVSFFIVSVRHEWGHTNYGLRERLNGIQEVSGSIPLISTRYVERLDFFGDQAFLFPKINIGMMLAASTAVQASSPSEKAVSTFN